MFNKIIGFLKEVKVELTKVSWSTREELVGSTTVVIVLTIIMAIFIGLIDLFFSSMLKMVLK